MARLSLRDAVGKAHAELADGFSDDEELAGAIVSAVRRDHPEREWKVRSVQNAAADVTGTERPEALARRAQPDPASKRRSGRRRRAVGRGLPRRVRVAPAESFGALIAQMFLLVALYWLLRSAGAVETILARVRSAARWIVEPVGWGQRPS